MNSMKLDGCEFGLTAKHGRNKGVAIRKPWRVDSNCSFVLQNLDRQCSKKHDHAPCAGRDTKETERYTFAFVSAVHSAFCGWVKLRTQSPSAAYVSAACALVLPPPAAMAPRSQPSDVYNIGGAGSKSGRPPPPRAPSPRVPVPPKPPLPVRRPAAHVPLPPVPPPPRTLRADIQAWDVERAAKEGDAPEGRSCTSFSQSDYFKSQCQQ